MPAPNAQKPQNAPKPQTDSNANPEEEEPFVVEGPEDESFDEKYNKHQEFPLSLVGAILILVSIAALLVVMLTYIMGGEDRGGVPVKLVYLDGLDDAGLGSPGSGGQETDFKSEGDPFDSKDSALDPEKLPEVKEKLKETIKFLDPSGNLPISDANAKAYQSLSDSVQKKLLGARQGSGPGKGSGYDGSEGTGPGGTGSDSTLGRNLRWVLRFKVTSGRDYLDQLKRMNAEILIPEPASDKCTIIPDLKSPNDQRPATDDDLRRLGNKIKFADSRPEVVRAVSRELGLNFSPKSFWAFFPKNLEDELSKKETGYHNKRADDIDETIFLVNFDGANFSFTVVDQKLKK